MKVSVVLKQIKVTNSDTDSYVTIVLQANNNFSISELNDLRHKSLMLSIDEDNG